MHQRLSIVGRRPLAQVSIEVVAVPPAPQDSGKARLCSPGRLAHDATQGAPLVIRCHRNGNPAISALAGIDIVWRLPQVGRAKTRTADAALRFEQGWCNTRTAGYVHG